jgi:hypothetical protein
MAVDGWDCQGYRSIFRSSAQPYRSTHIKSWACHRWYFCSSKLSRMPWLLDQHHEISYCRCDCYFASKFCSSDGHENCLHHHCSWCASTLTVSRRSESWSQIPRSILRRLWCAELSQSRRAESQREWRPTTSAPFLCVSGIAASLPIRSSWLKSVQYSSINFAISPPLYVLQYMGLGLDGKARCGATESVTLIEKLEHDISHVIDIGNNTKGRVSESSNDDGACALLRFYDFLGHGHGLGGITNNSGVDQGPQPFGTAGGAQTQTP